MIPADLRQFRMKTVLIGFGYLSIASALSAAPFAPVRPLGYFMWLASLGLAFLFASDFVDAGHIDERNELSTGFNFLGVVFLVGPGAMFVFYGARLLLTLVSGSF